MVYTLATILSRIFDPFFVVSILVGLTFWNSGLAADRALLLFSVIYILAVGIPVVLLLRAIRAGKLSNWDLSDRRERILPILAELCLLFVCGLLIYIFGNAFILRVFFSIFLWFFGFFIITLFWKISGHVATNTLVAGLLLRWYGWNLWPILAVIPLVGWSRIFRKNHTPAQVMAGALYSTLYLGICILAGFL